MGAVIAGDHIAEPFLHGNATFNHGFTFGGHPVSCAVALANIDVIEREELCANVRANEAPFRAMLEGLRDLPIVGDVRGAGYFQAIELVKDKDTKETFNAEESEELLRGFLSGELYSRGLICRTDDRGDPIVQLSPPLIAGREQFEEIEAVLRPVLARGIGADGAVELTVESLIGELGLQLVCGQEAAEDARALGAQHRAARSHALAERGRAAAHHRHPAERPQAPARVHRASGRAPRSPASGSAPASRTSACRRRC